ncbi:MAG: hypothetical protein M1820_000623 [Bogoriella megaspora]|nr:MAG: hypothetical protein M1820_000623 [Bogoriella megaspora]
MCAKSISNDNDIPSEFLSTASNYDTPNIHQRGSLVTGDPTIRKRKWRRIKILIDIEAERDSSQEP